MHTKSREIIKNPRCQWLSTGLSFPIPCQPTQKLRQRLLIFLGQPWPKRRGKRIEFQLANYSFPARTVRMFKIRKNVPTLTLMVPPGYTQTHNFGVNLSKTFKMRGKSSRSVRSLTKSYENY